MCVCVYFVIPYILDVGLEDVPAGVTQEEGHPGFLHLHFAVLALIFLARRIQPSLSPVDSEVKFFVLQRINRFPLAGAFFILLDRKSIEYHSLQEEYHSLQEELRRMW